jgi:hypothetical protein
MKPCLECKHQVGAPYPAEFSWLGRDYEYNPVYPFGFPPVAALS